MAARRIKLSPRQRDELLLAWHELSSAHKKARKRVAALLSEHDLTPETSGRLASENGELVFVVNDNHAKQVG